MKKLLTLLSLTFCISSAYAQDENQISRKRQIETTESEKLTKVGTETSIYIKKKADGLFEIRLNDEVLEVNTNAKIIKGPGKSKGGANQSGSRGLPVKGSTVKGGKNPGPNHKILSANEDGSYTLPKEWGAGNYRLEIILPDTEPSVIVLLTIDETGTARIQPGSNFKGAGSPKQAGF